VTSNQEKHGRIIAGIALIAALIVAAAIVMLWVR
jgi:hypothetical protein